MKLIEVEETDSTNSLSLRLAADHAAPFAVMAMRQTAGRGQRGNSWESAPGKNVTLSVYCRPGGVEAAEQFVISQAVAVAIVRLLEERMPRSQGDISVKWPNDIYVGDRKICGVLIENALNGPEIVRSVIGIGLNVNQRRFESDAPNPVSMWQLCGHHFDISGIAADLCDGIEMAMALTENGTGREILRRDYFSLLWRSDGYYPYMDAATGECFRARIADIALSGHITLVDESGVSRVYAFKEVQTVID